MTQHLLSLSEEIEGRFGDQLKENDIILDIGSNDATLLKSYKSSSQKIGIDPTESSDL